MADNSLHLHQLHAKPDGSVSNFVMTTAPQLFLLTAQGKGQQNLMLRGKPLEDLGSVVATMSGLSRPLVLISQENSDTDYSLANHNEAASPRGVATNCDHAIAHGSGIPLHSPLPEGGNRTVDVTTINNSSSALPTNTAVQTHDVSTFFQQQMLLNCSDVSSATTNGECLNQQSWRAYQACWEQGTTVNRRKCGSKHY